MYTFHSKIRYSEVDKNGILPLSSIINYFQDCSTFQSEELKVGPHFLKNLKRSWILNGWQVKLNRRPEISEEITVGTWAYDFKGIYGYRNFIMKDSDDKVIAAANSLWVFIDNETNRPTRIPDDISSIYEIEPAFPMHYADRKIIVPEEATYYPSFPVLRSHIDSYNHVNNGKYIRIAEDYIPETFYVTQLRVEYRFSAVLGDTILPKVSFKDNCYIIALCNTLEKPYALLEFQGINHNNLCERKEM